MYEEIRDKVSLTLLKTVKLIEKCNIIKGNILRDNIINNKKYYNSELEQVDINIIDLRYFKTKLVNINYKLNKGITDNLIPELDYCIFRIKSYEYLNNPT